jgi:hypothetical protein
MKKSLPLHNTTPEHLTRRKFVARCAAATACGVVLRAVPGFTLAAMTAQSAKATLASDRPPVVSFHLDRPYLDNTGLAPPYLPPPGSRSAQPFADLSLEELMRRHAYF